MTTRRAARRSPEAPAPSGELLAALAVVVAHADEGSETAARWLARFVSRSRGMCPAAAWIREQMRGPDDDE